MGDYNSNLCFHPLMELNYDYIRHEIILHRKTIRILTYNIFLRPPPVKNNESDWKDERLVDFIKLLDMFDIICLQEMFGSLNNRKQQLIKYANKAGYFFYCECPSPSFFSKYVAEGGLIILSRFPIVEKEFYPFRYSILSDSLCQKGVLYAKIRIGNSYLCIFNTHLQASYFDGFGNQWDLSIKTRIDQTDELIHFVKEVMVNMFFHKGDLMLDKQKFILLGDFNIDAHDYGEKRKKIKLPKYDKTEYDLFFDKLKQFGIVNDLFKNKFEKHPFTYGYNGEDFPMYDSTLTCKEDVGSNQTLDYIFEIIPNLNSIMFRFDTKELKCNSKINLSESKEDSLDSQENLKQCELLIDYESVKVEEFLVSNKPYQQLSDHFGLSVEVRLNSYADV